MDAEELRRRADPEGLPPLLAAMWWDGRGEWERAHGLAQVVDTAEGAWVHAYLHRKEGDLGNADYWYRRAGRRRPADPLDAEWGAIVAALAP
jgi:hypothetical protein